MKKFSWLFVPVLLLALSCGKGVVPPAPLKSAKSSEPAASVVYHPEVLGEIAEKVKRADDAGEKPIVLFDIDDTLVDVRTRHLPITHEFAADPQMRVRFPKECEKLAKAELSQMHYDTLRSLASLGVSDPEAVKAYDGFWKERFFSNRCENDEAFAGAVDYVQKLQRGLLKSGTTIVYLSGRDEPRMGAGTRKGLAKRGFPLGRDTDLILKPDAQLEDLALRRAFSPD
jgi:hypothetical protein